MTAADQKEKALCVATRCTTIEQFVATFHRFCDDSTFFVSTLAERPVGLETAFSIQLEDKTPVLRGLCEVVEAWSTPVNRFGRPGVRLAVKRLTPESLAVFKMLQVARTAAESAAQSAPLPSPVASGTTTSPRVTGPAPSAPVGTPIARIAPASLPQVPRLDPRVSPAPSLPKFERRPTPEAGTPVVAAVSAPPARVALPTSPSPIAKFVPPTAASTPPLPSVSPPPSSIAAPPSPPPSIIVGEAPVTAIVVESRTPGSSFVLPANPLMNLTDQSLGGFVDCALYEETGSFFRAPGYQDSLVDIDDVAVPPPEALSPVPAIRQSAPSGPTALSPYAFSPAPDRQFAPEATPLPQLAPQFPSPSPVRYSQPLLPPGVSPIGPPPVPRGSSVDNTASLLAMSSPDRRRWLLIGGGAVGGSLLLLVLVLIARGGGEGPKPPPMKVAAAAPPVKASPSDRPAPAAVETDVSPPSMTRPPPTTPSSVEAGKPAIAPPMIAPDPAEDGGDSSTPPVVGTGPCRLTVSSTPAGSIVRIDDQMIGPSPITFDGACKRRKVDVKHPRYALATKFVNLSPEKPASILVPLARPTHAITVVTVPPGATISIAGNRAGTSPTVVKVMGFTSVKLTVEKKGYSTIVQKVYSKVEQDRVMLKLVRGK